MSTMRISEIGEHGLGLAVLAMGVQSLCATVHLSNVPLGPPLQTQGTFVTSITCLFLATAGLSLVTGYGRRQAGVALAVVFGTRAAAVYLWKIFILTHQSGPWTATAELAALSAASLEVAVSYNIPIGAEPLNRVGLRWDAIARVVFGTSLLVFGIQHFMYARFIAGLIPAWVPARYAVGVAVGVGFILTGAAVSSGRHRASAGIALGSLCTSSASPA